MELLSIVGWNTIYENNRTRDLKKMDWVPIPNKLDGDGYTELLAHPDGALHYAAWVILVLVASRCQPRGTLIRAGGHAHDAASLSRISRIDVNVFLCALPRLVEIGWVAKVHVTGNGINIPQEGAGIPQEGAPRDARAGASVPFRSVPFRGGAGGAEKSSPAPDAAWDSFRGSAIENGIDGSAPDWDAARVEWDGLAFEGRLAAFRALGLDLVGKQNCLPVNYLRKRMWERPARQAQKTGGRGETEGIRWLREQIAESEEEGAA